jgi:hypothetical protein
MLSPPLVAARLGCFSLWDCHQRLPL